jgi:hypothetical protein
VLVRDNPDFDPARREAQLGRLAQVSSGLRDAGVPLLYELLRTIKEKERTQSSPLSAYSAPGGLRQDPGRAAE